MDEVSGTLLLRALNQIGKHSEEPLATDEPENMTSAFGGIQVGIIRAQTLPAKTLLEDGVEMQSTSDQM